MTDDGATPQTVEQRRLQQLAAGGVPRVTQLLPPGHGIPKRHGVTRGDTVGILGACTCTENAGERPLRTAHHQRTRNDSNIQPSDP